jgi:hypothetical protein
LAADNVPLASNQFDQLFHVGLGCCWVHAGELQELASPHARVTYHRHSAIEEALSNVGVDSVGVQSFPGWNVAKHDCAQLRLANQFKIAGGAYRGSGVIG